MTTRRKSALDSEAVGTVGMGLVSGNMCESGAGAEEFQGGGVGVSDLLCCDSVPAVAAPSVA
jgi:hypothetical protein